jgi:glycosyltransferase involved in cell wall biosynthesis
MKIFQVIESFGAGVYSFIVDLSNELSKEHEVYIIYSERMETPKNFHKDFGTSIKFIKLNMGIKQSVMATYHLYRLIKELNPDIVHLHSSKAGMVGRVAAYLSGYTGKLFYNPHGLAFLRSDLPKLARKVFYYAERSLSKLGGVIIAVSESEKKEIQRISNQVLRINNGVSFQETQDIQNPYSFPRSDSFVIGTIGRIEYQKNPVLFNKIAEKLPHIQFLWIGEGSLRKELISSNIVVTGWKSRKEVSSYLEGIDLYIQTSLWEGLPISVIEAMISRKPILVNNVIGNVDTVRNDINGYVCDSEQDFIDRIRLLVNNRELLKEMGENSYRFAKDEFNKEKSVEQYMQLYNEFTINNVKSSPDYVKTLNS